MRSIDSGRDVHVEEGTLHVATEGSIRHSGPEETERNLRQVAGKLFNTQCSFNVLMVSICDQASQHGSYNELCYSMHGLAMSELENGKGLKERVLPVRQSSQQ